MSSGIARRKNCIVRDILPTSEPLVTATGRPRLDSDNDSAPCSCLADKMKKTLYIFAACSVAFAVSSCSKMSPDEYYIRQTIPIEIQHGKPVTIEISPSGNGLNDVGIRCPLEIWDALRKGTKVVEVRLVSSDKPKTEIGGTVPPGAGTEFLGHMPDVHYLFCIHGEHAAKATVAVTFPNGLTSATKAEIIVCKTPIDTEPGGDR